MFTLQPIPASLESDFRYCSDVVRSHEENFPVASLLTPPRLRPFMCAVYAFARTADDFADLPGRDDATRLNLLDDWSRRLLQAEAGTPDHPIFRALAHVIQATNLPPMLLHELLIAFRMDVTNKHYDTMEELLEYCRYSANPIGRIILHMAGEIHLGTGQDAGHKIRHSDALCTALQLTNHWQDMGQDVWCGRPLYIPREEMERFGVSEEMILKRRYNPSVGSLMLHLAAETKILYQSGRALLDQVHWPLNMELAAIIEGGETILAKIEASGGNTLRFRPRLSLWDKTTCLWRVLARTLS